MQSAASQAVSATHKAHSVSIGEVSSRTHMQGESEDHYEASSREFSNLNKCHAVTYTFYRINKKQKVKFELVAIERRVLDDNAPIGGVLQTPAGRALPIALVPQDIAATAVIKRTTVAGNMAAASLESAVSLAATPNLLRSNVSVNTDFKAPIDNAVREKALNFVSEQLIAKNLIDKEGKVSKEIKQSVEFESEFSLPTPGVIVKGCLDECDVCEPLLKERMQLENDLLRKQIELLEKSQEYRCCPVAAEEPCP